MICMKVFNIMHDVIKTKCFILHNKFPIKFIEFIFIGTEEHTVLADNVICKIFCILCFYKHRNQRKTSD